MAMPLAIVRSWGEQAVSIMGHTSRCCMVCLMPQSQVSVSFEYPHFDMFNLDQPTCVRNRLSAFQVVRGFSAPAGRCSSALMFRCTLASRGSSRSRHSSRRAAFAVVLMGSVHLMKLFSDLRRGTTPRCPLSGCHWSVVCRVRSVRLATALLMSDGAIPVSTDRLLLLVASDILWSFYRFHSVSHPVSLRGWSAPTPDRLTLQLSNIALEQMTWVWLGWLPILRFLVCGWCCFLFRLSFWSSRCVLYMTRFCLVWRQDIPGCSYWNIAWLKEKSWALLDSCV